MTEAIVFPDVEALLVSALPSVIGAPVATKVPAERPPLFVRVTRVGGTRRDTVTDLPMVVVECWADTWPAAIDLARVTQARVFALAQTSIGSDWVRSVPEVGGLQRFPDPVSGSPRYQFTAQIQTRGVPL